MFLCWAELPPLELAVQPQLAEDWSAPLEEPGLLQVAGFARSEFAGRLLLPGLELRRCRKSLAEARNYC